MRLLTAMDQRNNQISSIFFYSPFSLPFIYNNIIFVSLSLIDKVLIHNNNKLSYYLYRYFTYFCNGIKIDSYYDYITYYTKATCHQFTH